MVALLHIEFQKLELMHLQKILLLKLEMANVVFLLTRCAQHIAKQTWVAQMLPEQLNRVLKLFCGLPQDRLMKTLKLAYFGKTEQAFLGKSKILVDYLSH
jgi:hypothetical protein